GTGGSPVQSRTKSAGSLLLSSTGEPPLPRWTGHSLTPNFNATEFTLFLPWLVPLLSTLPVPCSWFPDTRLRDQDPPQSRRPPAGTPSCLSSATCEWQYRNRDCRQSPHTAPSRRRFRDALVPILQ